MPPLSQNINCCRMPFLKRNYLLLLILFAAIQVAHAQTTSFNLSHGSQPVSGWIDVVGDPYISVVSVTDTATGFKISSVNTANWAPYSGTCSYDHAGASGGTFFPAAVMLNHWFQYGSAGAYNAAVPQFIVSGLNPKTVYTFRMTGSYLNGGTGLECNPIHYTVTGAAVTGALSINGDSNTVNGATFSNVVPDTTGKVRIYVNTYGAANLASINGVQVIAGQTASFWSTSGNTATGGDTSFVGTTDTNRLSFRTSNIERMTIRGDGTIGIGTKDTKGYNLAVNGSGIFTSVWVKPYANWPDYVFRKGYSLPSLDSLSAYIRTYTHLPGIPSADSVQRTGIDVGGTQAALLQKIEELTLYLIQENRRLEKQQCTIDEQNARLEAQQREIDSLKKLILNKPKQN